MLAPPDHRFLSHSPREQRRRPAFLVRFGRLNPVIDPTPASPRRLRRLACFLVSLGLAATLARADTLHMPNGEQLEGAVVSESADTIVFHSNSFGEIRVTRVSGLRLDRGATPLPSVATATVNPAPAATPAPAGPSPQHPPARKPSWIAQALGLSDRWSLEFQANLFFLNSEYHLKNHAFESTLGYKIPTAGNPKLTRHEFGLFGSYERQMVEDTVVDEKSEVAARYFFQPGGRWMFISQADWSQDRLNSVEFSSNAIGVPAYKFIDRESTRLLAGVGPSLRAESRILTTPAGTTYLRDQTTFRATFYQVFQHRFTPLLTFRQTLLVMPRPDDLSTYSLRFQASLRRMLTPHLSLNLDYDYVRDQNDIFPLQSVGTFMLMLGYEL
jgi:hypothetical protein